MDSNVLIVPEPGQEKETLRRLLALSTKPRHVKISSDDGGYLVPEYVAEKFNATSTDEEPQESTPTPEEPQEQVAPKRRGRPPGSRNKAPEAADDKDGEE